LDLDLQREISSLWQSDEVSRTKPTPQMEAERGTLVVENVLWEALPSYFRKLSATMEATIGKKLPLDAAPVIFSSWMGGDRDGNPNVTAAVTREVILKKRSQAAGLYARDLKRLERELTIQECSDELRAVVGDASEPYRAMIWPVSSIVGNSCEKFINCRVLTLIDSYCANIADDQKTGKHKTLGRGTTCIAGRHQARCGKRIPQQ
jgi:phosphoenolpyruvate carboxylase